MYKKLLIKRFFRRFIKTIPSKNNAYSGYGPILITSKHNPY